MSRPEATVIPPQERRLARVVDLAPPAPGFIGEGHTAVEVVGPTDLAATDPFVLLMDDRLDLPRRRRIGGPHPHAGLETVTLVLEGELHDRDEGTLRAGDVLWMNAGRGVVHNEHVEAGGRSRVLQLWVRLPAADRDSLPSFQLLRAADAPVQRDQGAEVRLYSGAFGALRAPIRNHAPVTLADVRLAADGAVAVPLPGAYHGFLLPLEGRVAVGGREVGPGQVAWLDRSPAAAETVLRATAAGGPARFVLYAGAPQREPLVHHGPFVAGSPQELVRLFHRFRAGDFEPLSRVALRQRTSASAG